MAASQVSMAVDYLVGDGSPKTPDIKKLLPLLEHDVVQPTTG